MPYNPHMICLDVYLNGEKLCRAGREDLVVLNAMLNWVIPHGELEEMNLEVGGLARHELDGNTHLRWTDDKNVSIGDEITLRFVDADTADKPVYEKTEPREWIEEQQRKYYEQMKAKYENG